MKHPLLLLFCSVSLLFASHAGIAQITAPSIEAATTKPQISVSSVTLKNGTVQFMLTSSKHFLTGGNLYILHIGDKEFPHSRQDINDEQGIITFLIPKADFDALPDGADLYLAYGHHTSAQQPDQRNNNFYWSLGTFTRSLLTK